MVKENQSMVITSSTSHREFQRRKDKKQRTKDQKTKTKKDQKNK